MSLFKQLDEFEYNFGITEKGVNMVVKNVEIIYHSSTSEIEEVQTRIDAKNRKGAWRDGLLTLLCFFVTIGFVIGFISFINSFMDKWDFGVLLVPPSLLMILLFGYLLYLLVKGFLVFKGYNFDSDTTISECLVLSKKLINKEPLSYDIKNQSIAMEDESKEVLYYDLPREMETVERTDLIDKVILNLDKKKLYIPFELGKD
jgi:hypothetical protein